MGGNLGGYEFRSRRIQLNPVQRHDRPNLYNGVLSQITTCYRSLDRMELMSESDPGGLCQGWVQPGYLTDTHYFSVVE